MQIVPDPCTWEGNLKLLLLRSEVSAGVLMQSTDAEAAGECTTSNWKHSWTSAVGSRADSGPQMAQT